MAVLGQEELLKVAVNLEQAVPVDDDVAILHGEMPRLAESFEGLGESDGRVDPELKAEILETQAAQLQLEDEFANEALLRRGGEGPVDGESLVTHGGNVGIEVVMVLVVGAADMAEGEWR